MPNQTLEPPSHTLKGKRKVVRVSRDDLVEAWMLIEGMASSLATIGRCHLQPDESSPDPKIRQEALEAIEDYLSPELFNRFNNARFLIADYLGRDEVEKLSEESEEAADAGGTGEGGLVPYWTWFGYEKRRRQSPAPPALCHANCKGAELEGHETE